MAITYMTTEELAQKIHYNARTIRNELVDECLIQGRHYIRPFGRRKLLFIWETIEEDMLADASGSIAMPIAEENE